MKIPLYNKGLGGQGVTTGGSLGPRASYGDFTGVGQATAQFAQVANKVATDFFDAEAQSVADDANTKASLQYREKLNEFNRTNGSLSVAEYDAKFTKFKDVELKRVSGQYKLRKDHQQKLNNSLEIIAANGKEAGRQSSFIKGTKIRAQNAQDHISTIIDEYVITTEPGAKLKLKQKLEEQQKINLANGYTPYLEYKTTDDALKEADKRGLLIDINSEDQTIDNLELMQKEVINPKSEKYKSYSASERETFDAKIQSKINYLRDGRTAELEQDYNNLAAKISINPENAEKEIDILEKKYDSLGEAGKKIFLPMKSQLLIRKGIAERVKPYELQSVSSMQAALINQENKAKTTTNDKVFQELAILNGMKEKFAAISTARTADPVLYIKLKRGTEVDSGELIATQKRMGLSEKDIKIHTNEEMEKIFRDYDAMETTEAASFLKKLTEDARAKDTLKYLMPHMMKKGFSQYENLSMINPLSSINNTFLAAKKATKEQIAATTEPLDLKLINQEVNRQFNDFRESVTGQALYGSALQNNNRGSDIDAIEMAIAKTARYIKSRNIGLTNEQAANQAMSIIDDSYEMRSINSGSYRMPNEKVMPDDYSKVDMQLNKIISDKVFLKGIIKVPTDSTPETYMSQASGGFRWVTNEDETGVFLINANANGSQVQNKNTGKRIEYTWEQLITKSTASELTAEEKRDVQIYGVTEKETEGLAGEEILKIKAEKAAERRRLRDQEYINMNRN